MIQASSFVRIASSALVCFALAAALPRPAHAWGFEAHRLIAELAEQQLTPAAKAEANRLLELEPGSTLSSVSTWADEIRSRETGPWHYVNFPRGSCSYDKARDCPTGSCVIEAIGAQLAILKSKAPDADRLQALKFVVHLIGDVHQPLHAGYADDKGGNTVQLQSFGKGSNLHSLWDSGLVANRVGGAAALKQEISAASQGAAPAATANAALWATESCKIVEAAGFYPDSRKVDGTYLAAHEFTLKARLTAAANRLAAVLNDSLR